MPKGQVVNISGFVTLSKYIKGRTLADIEKILGFHPGRLLQGATFAELQRMPRASEFEARGYSQVADHHHKSSNGVDPDKLKQIVIAEVWSKPGERLVKVIPGVGHNPAMAPNEQYPPGLGVPQWKLTARLPAMIMAEINNYPAGRY
jgi:hypothetical protein